MLAFLDWSRSTITFDHDDHLDRVSQLGRYPLIVDPIIGNTWLTKILMDRVAASTSCTLRPLMPWGSVEPSSARAEHLSTASY
jgi:hypothetical protein